MKIIFVLVTIASMLLGHGGVTYAQQQPRVPKVGLLIARASSTGFSASDLLRRELRTLGYMEGKNIAFETRRADNRLDQLREYGTDRTRAIASLLFTGTAARFPDIRFISRMRAGPRHI
jgi:hypothetical protein